MSYQSIWFIVFVGIALFIYYLPGRKRQRGVLAVANLAFYLCAGVRYLPFLAATMLATFWAGKKMGAIYRSADAQIAACADAGEKKALRAGAKAQARRVLLAGMLIAIGLLVVCKYTGFIMENLNRLLGLARLPQLGVFRTILPLGISFYTFMALSYILDVYWKRYKAEERFVYYAVYLSYFPHIVQGPIDRFNEFRAQIESPVRFSYQNLTFGAQLALWGFFKKLVVADRIGLFVNAVFDNHQAHYGFVLIAAVAAYSIQIYADFSGCIDIVTGVSEMFGIRLRKNFDHPYFSRSMGEFWRRWHISLQEWFKDYVYYPVSASSFMRKVKKRLRDRGAGRSYELFSSCFPVLVVWSVTGIWHGASWKFVAWGFFHASLLIASKVFEPVSLSLQKRMGGAYRSPLWKFVQMLRTFALCCLGRVFFRASDLPAALSILKKMLDPRITLAALMNPPARYGIDAKNVFVAVIGILILLIVDVVQERCSIRAALAKRNIALRWSLIYICLFMVLILGIYGPEYGASGFIYEQF